jgi:hypothetical protein
MIGCPLVVSLSLRYIVNGVRQMANGRARVLMRLARVIISASVSALCVFAAGCSVTLPAHYAYHGALGSEDIEFHRDQTFTYVAVGDDGPARWSASGIWKWQEHSRSKIETTVLQWLASPPAGAVPPLRDREVWTIAHESARRRDRQVLRRVRDSNQASPTGQ